MLENQIRNSVRERPCFARSSSGNDQQGTAKVFYGLALAGVEVAQEVNSGRHSNVVRRVFSLNIIWVDAKLSEFGG